MIKIENLNFRYKEGASILKNINVEISKGECIAIVGKNGSGKSTLAKLVSGVIKPSNGNILVDEINTKNKKEYISLRRKIGIVFQNPENQIIFNNLNDELSFALNNLGLDNQELRINQALEQVKIDKEIIREIDELSLGQKQRIAIASVLAVNPDYLVFDEPTTMIDSEGKEAVYNIISNLKERGYTIIYITNNTEEIFLADRILVLDNGEIVEQMQKTEIVNKVEIFKKYNLKIPQIVTMLEILKKNNIEIELKKWTIEEIMGKIVGAIKNEKCN